MKRDPDYDPSNWMHRLMGYSHQRAIELARQRTKQPRDARGRFMKRS